MRPILSRLFCGLMLHGIAAYGASKQWQEGPGYRSAPLTVPQRGKTGFTQISSSQTGIPFSNHIAWDRHLTNQMLLNGSGVAAGDVDGDGWCDLYFCGLDGPNALYRNLGGWKFEDITASAGVACTNLDATGAVLVDIDGDYDLDLLVNTMGQGTHLFLNNGTAQFTRFSSTLNPGHAGTTTAIADIDGDGWLDVYISNYRSSALVDMPNTHFRFNLIDGKQVVTTVNGRPATDPEYTNRFVVTKSGGISELGEADALYRNLGGTNFVPVSFTGGAFLDEDGKPLSSELFDWGLSAMFYDMNQDGLPDLYVCNDFDTPDRIWINKGNGSFQAIPRLALRKTSLFSMGVDFADINRDGSTDFVLLDMLGRSRHARLTQMPDRSPPVPVIGRFDDRPQYLMNTLFIGRGDGTFAEIAQLSGIEATDWSWTPVFLDVDLDGWEDLLITNGNERDARNMDVADVLQKNRRERTFSNLEILRARKIFPRLATRNIAFRNRRDLTFKDVSQEWGFDFAGVSHGMALADLDNDGDLDVAINNLNDPAGLYRNESGAPRVAVQLKGLPPNTRGIGSRIKVSGGPVVQQQEIISGGRYLSSDEPLRVFAAGGQPTSLTIEVLWRSGRQSRISNVEPNRVYQIDEAAAAFPRPEAPPPKAPPLFTDVSHLIRHSHHEENFNDFERQPLLPRKLSQSGPGVSWIDLNGDEFDDLVIGSGKGGALAAFRNERNGTFSPLEQAPFKQSVARDQTAILPFRDAAGRLVLLAGSANYEDGFKTGSCVRHYYLEPARIVDALPGYDSSTGPLAMADIDSDGDLDLFVGGRCLPAKYPQPASSLLFRNVCGQLEADAENNPQLANLGLISGAVFSDLDNDGDPDLLLACEWGSLRILRNNKGKFSEATEELGLTELKGWWNGINVGDFDGDGRMDVVASNWGRNSPYQSFRAEPLQIIYGERPADVVETCYDQGLAKRVPLRPLDAVAKVFPWMREQFATHELYAAASVKEVFGSRLQSSKMLEANWLDSTVFFNRGTHFDARPLPIDAQLAPAFGIGVADFDGDGHEDIFLSQNFFATRAETPRYDAGLGLVLRGNGRGGFAAVSAPASGIRIFGEQRGCALADFDGDGCVDLAVAENGAATKLYRNTAAQPGIRVRLRGPPGNPETIGAIIRPGFGNKTFGPARELHCGSGYWSHDSSVQVLGPLNEIRQILVRWPGGTETLTDLPSGARRVTIDANGKIVSK